MPDRPQTSVRQVIQGAPVLHVPDVEAAAREYRDRLGFTFDYGDAGYAVVWRENAAVHFLRGDGPPAGVHLFFWVEDVDALHAELAGRGARILEVPTDRTYGLREFVVEDLNGVRVVFAQDID
jgi:catechol 2,3-dioxygenase-like lactoylglutathione lyase family enzyme